MSRSKSPDSILERLKSREKPQVNKIALGSFKSQEKKLSKLYLNSQGSRINSISNFQSSKKIHRKVSVPKLKSALNKSPSSPISIKNELSSSFSISSAVRPNDIKKLEETYKKITDFDARFESHPKASEFFPNSQKAKLINSLFSDLIESAKQYSHYLLIIKRFYEDYFEKNPYEEIEKLKKEIRASLNQIEKLHSEKTSLERTLDKLAKENLSISKDLEDSEQFNSHLQEKLSLLHTFNIDRIPLNKETWKCLVIENNYFSDMCKNLKSELRSYKYNEQILEGKLEVLRAKGVDVQMILEEAEREKGANSDEGIVSSRAKSPNKPRIVPELDIEGIEGNQEESSEYASGFSGQ